MNNINIKNLLPGFSYALPVFSSKCLNYRYFSSTSLLSSKVDKNKVKIWINFEVFKYEDFVNFIYFCSNTKLYGVIHLTGKFGMDFLKTTTKLLNKEKHNIIATTRILKDSLEIDENLFLDSYKPTIDKKVCEDFDLDFIKVLNTENFDLMKNKFRVYLQVLLKRL